MSYKLLSSSAPSISYTYIKVSEISTLKKEVIEKKVADHPLVCQIAVRQMLLKKLKP